MKVRNQPRRARRSWRVTVERERINVERNPDEIPSLRPKLAGLFAKRYADARRLAATETRLPIATFPVDPPFSLDELRSGPVSNSEG